MTNSISNLVNGKVIIRFNLLQTSDSTSQTNSWRYELENDIEEDIRYSLERRYEGCNYISSLEEISQETGLSEHEVLTLLLNDGRIDVWERTNTMTWEVSQGWN